MGIPNKAGFTLIEVIAVLVVASIISVVIITRALDTRADLISAADVVKTHLRYAQSRAMSDNDIWGIRCDGTKYWLFSNGDTTDIEVLPGESNDTINYTVSTDPLWQNISSIEVFTISFDDWGIPHTDAAATDGNELASGDDDAQITVTSGGNSETITITPNTGFIP